MQTTSKKNKVFIAASIDGYIADKDGRIDWLNSIPNPDKIDMGYKEFISEIDALILGRSTFETIIGFDIPWPYKNPVYVLSNSLKSIPEEFEGKAIIVKGDLNTIIDSINNQGFYNLYIDGGRTIQSFMKEDLIDEIIITTIPIILGGGTPLFGNLPRALKFELVESTLFLDQIVQNRYHRKK